MSLTKEQVTDAVMEAQATLQTPLGIYRMNDPEWRGKNGMEPADAYDERIEERLWKTLAQLHALLDALGRPMFDPATHPDVKPLLPDPTPRAIENDEESA